MGRGTTAGRALIGQAWKRGAGYGNVAGGDGRGGWAGWAAKRQDGSSRSSISFTLASFTRAGHTFYITAPSDSLSSSFSHSPFVSLAPEAPSHPHETEKSRSERVTLHSKSSSLLSTHITTTVPGFPYPNNSFLLGSHADHP